MGPPLDRPHYAACAFSRYTGTYDRWIHPFGLLRSGDTVEQIAFTAVLVERPGEFDAPAWYLDDEAGDHSVAAQQRAVLHYAGLGGVSWGAFAGDRLVGIGIVVPHLRPSIAQLAFLHVSDGFRDAGLGARLTACLEDTARHHGDTEMVVTATPSRHTVRFYLGRGYRPMAEPLPELFELEPEDVHMSKRL